MNAVKIGSALCCFYFLRFSSQSQLVQGNFCKEAENLFVPSNMVLVGEVGVVPSGKIYRQIFDDEVRLVRSLEQGRNRAAQHKCPVSSAKIPLVKDLETCAGKGLLSPRQQKWVEGMPYDDFTENPVFYKYGLEYTCLFQEMEHFILETETLLLTKLSESNRKIELLLKKIECDSDLEAFSIELWDDITQDLLHRRQWIREMDETLNKYEVARAEKVSCCLIFFTLLANRRAIAKLFVNLMEADLKKELSLRFKWQDRVKDWKIMQKDYVVHSFRKFMASEEIQNPPEVKRDLENMKKEQISLDSQRMKLLQHLRYGESDSNNSIYYNTHNVQCMMRIRLHYERVWQECLTEVQKCKNKLLNLKVCTEEEAEKVVNPEFFQLIGNLQSQFEEELEQMDIDFEDLAKLTEQNCKDLYKYFQEALVLWDVHQLNLTQQENELQMKLKGCRQKHENQNQIQELNLDIILDKLRTQSNEGKLTSHLESAFSSLDDIRAGYAFRSENIVERVAAYPEAILKELIAYSTSISQYFNVKEVFQQVQTKQTGWFKILLVCYMFIFGKFSLNLSKAIRLQRILFCGKKVQFKHYDIQKTRTLELVEESETENTEEQQKAESFARESEEAEQSSESLQLENEETNAGEDKESLAQEAEETEKQGAGKSSAQGSEGTDQLEESDNFAQQREEAEIFEDEENQECKGDDLQGILPEVGLYFFHKNLISLSTSANLVMFIHTNPSVCLAYAHKTPRFPFTAICLYLNSRIRLGFFEHLEMWFAQSLSNACIIVTAKKEELNSELQLRLHLHEPRHERIEKEIHDVRAAELAHHRDRLESHCTALMEALNKEKSEFLKIREHQSDISKEFRALIQDMESIFLAASNAEKLISLSNILHSEMRNHVEVIQISLRSYRNYLEEALRKLRDSNMDFLKSCRLFSEGGNFSSEEVELFCKRLEQETARIDFVEGIIMGDMEKMESNYLEQANEVIGKFESKFHYLAVDRLFMDKIQRFLTNLQVKIKSEDFLLFHLQVPTLVLPEIVIQGSLTAAVRTESLREENKVMVMGIENTPLLNPMNVIPFISMSKVVIPSTYVFNILLIAIASYFHEEFYRKDKHQITRPDYLQETFEQCAEVLGQKLLSYQAQTDDYYNSCLRGKFLEQILYACATACAQKFVSALASLTERMLLEFDECITVDEVQEAIDSKFCLSVSLTLKQCAFFCLTHFCKKSKRKIMLVFLRTWPEIPATVLTDAPDYVLCRETASVTTAKTTVGHLSAAEARDAAYMKYKQRLDKEFACIKEESTAQLMKAQHWEDWWKQSIQKIKQLYV
uniref:Coiled-coil domain containing 180 n=1 Tax=Crocodylus porosus TaxID=8502 RepID=A0A7M4EI71_CROPO